MRSFSLNLETLENDSAIIAILRQGVRVCTKGICLANVLSRNNFPMDIGDPLTADVFIDDGANDFFTNDYLVKAESGDFVISGHYNQFHLELLQFHKQEWQQ